MTNHTYNYTRKAIVAETLIWKYCAWLFLSSWGLQIAAISLTDGLDDPEMSWWLAATMLSPGVVTICFLKLNPVLRPKLLWKPGPRLIVATLLGVLIPVVMAFIVLSFFNYLHWGNSQWFNFFTDGVVVSGGPFLLGQGSQSWIVFFFNIIVTGFFFAILNSFLAAGEEIAWRGLLQGMLMDRLGKWSGIMLLGFLWSMWHLPIQLAGYNYPANPIIGSVIVSPLLLIGYSIFMAWLTVYSKSFIPAAISHGAINGIQEGIISTIDITVPELSLYLIRLMAAAIVAIAFAVLLSKQNTKL